MIEFDEPKTLEDTIRKARYCHEQFGHRTEPREGWKQKNSSEFQKKGFKSPRFKNYKKNSRMSFPAQSVHQQNFPSLGGNKLSGSAPVKTDNPKREPLKCWGCGEEHLLRDCPHRQQTTREFTAFNKLPPSMMWPGVCRKFMQPWIITKLTTKLQWWK
jgi:hypothetical protein